MSLKKRKIMKKLNKRKMISFLLFFPYLFMLNACTSLNSQFECPMKGGVRCESLDQVNAQVDNGEIGYVGVINDSHDSQFNSDKGYIKNKGNQDNSINERHVFRDDKKPIRYGETVMHVWIAPYEDTSENYHQESEIYTIVKPSHWIGYPLNETQVEQ